MANERTFLAWLRTSLSLVTIGIGIVQLFKIQAKQDEISDSLNELAKLVGAGFIVLGVTTLILGSLRYFKVQSMLLTSFYPASQYSVFFVILIVFILISVTLVVVFSAK